MDKRKLAGLAAVAVALLAAVGAAAPAAAAQTAAQEPAQAPQEPAQATQEQGAAQEQESAQERPAPTKEYEFPVLRQGHRGDVVRIAQRLLTYHGHPTGADGIFGPRTARSVRALQVDGGLPVTGVIDVATWERLVVEARRGDRGEAVRVLQWLLSFHGYPVANDGIFGQRTEAALQAFQGEYELPASGVASLRTWRVLVGNVKA